MGFEVQEMDRRVVEKLGVGAEGLGGGPELRSQLWVVWTKPPAQSWGS